MQSRDEISCVAPGVSREDRERKLEKRAKWIEAGRPAPPAPTPRVEIPLAAAPPPMPGPVARLMGFIEPEPELMPEPEAEWPEEWRGIHR